MNKLIYHMLSGRFGAGIEIHVLMRETAKIFGRDARKTAKAIGMEAPGAAWPPAAGLPSEELLRRYARFTADAAVSAVRSGQDLKTLRRRLYHMARRMGSDVRRRLDPRDERECLAILTMLYRNIGITIRETNPGKFCVYKCYFSSFYTPEVCSVISAIDRGIFAGIYGGGRLVFSERITEGHDVCRAELLRERSRQTGPPVRRQKREAWSRRIHEL